MVVAIDNSICQDKEYNWLISSPNGTLCDRRTHSKYFRTTCGVDWASSSREDQPVAVCEKGLDVAISRVVNRVNESHLVLQHDYAKNFLGEAGKEIPTDRTACFNAALAVPMTQEEVDDREIPLDPGVFWGQLRRCVACLGRYRVGCCECCWCGLPFYAQDVLLATTAGEVKSTRARGSVASEFPGGEGVAGAMPAASDHQVGQGLRVQCLLPLDQRRKP
jgi:hypothetical protein